MPERQLTFEPQTESYRQATNQQFPSIGEIRQPNRRTQSREIPPQFNGIMSYNPWHDICDHLELRDIEGQLPQSEYTQLLLQTNNRIKRQLEKTIGERFRVRSSEVEYFIQDGKLRSLDLARPVVEQYEKGRRYLKSQGSTETERESAEVQGVQKVEEILASGKLKTGEKVIVASPKGSKGTLYNDNYFDVYEQNSDKIKMTRYHSTHSLEQFLEASAKANPGLEISQGEPLSAAYFLENPTITKNSIGQITCDFGLDIKTQQERTNRAIIETCMPMILYYVRKVAEKPEDYHQHRLTINAIYNKADETDRLLKSPQKVAQFNVRQIQNQTIGMAINHYGHQPVRQVSFGCPGGQKGFDLNQPQNLFALGGTIAAQSVLDFAKFDEDHSDFRCPGTKDGQPCTYIVKYGSGTKKCPECGMEATCG